MIAQISTGTIIGTATVISGAIGGCYVFIFRHIANNGRHPKKDDIMYREVCAEKQKNIELKFTIIKEDLEEIKKLIKNNGNSTPRIQT